LFFKFALKSAIRRVQVNRDSLKLNGKHQLVVYVNGVNILGGTAAQSYRFSTRLQQNAIVCGIYGMKGFNVISK
jgi:hypothetical protein